MGVNKQTISKITETNQCVSCGLCSAVCPQDCISFDRHDGIYIPQIDDEKCMKCELCFRICPGNQFDYNREYQVTTEPEDFWFGNYRGILSMQSKNDVILKNATSGGVVTQLVRNLLDCGDYDCAFLVDTYNYSQQVHTKKFESSDNLLKTTKSRYIPVTQKDAIAYALKNRDKRIIFVGTGCFVHGLINVCRNFSLSRDHYFIIGLFCDRTMHYGIYDYFKQHPKCKGTLNHLLFRTKETGGWPGNMRLTFRENGGFVDLKSTERMAVKDYFQLERCLYCLDKLNQFADISVGDDYATTKIDKRGRSAVIIRTEQGEKIIEHMATDFHSYPLTKTDLAKSQKLHLRKKNLDFITARRLTPKIPQKVIRNWAKNGNDSGCEYQDRIRKLKMGRVCDYRQIRADIPYKKKLHYLTTDILHGIPFFGTFKYAFRKIRHKTH